MKNIKIVLLLTLILVLMLAACSSSDNTSTSGSENSSSSGETVNIDFSLFSTENDTFSVLFKEWADKVEEGTEGRVTITPFYSGQLSSLFETLDSVKNGTVDGGALSAGAISGDITSMGLLEPIGVFKNEEDFQGFYKDANSLMSEIFNSNGVELTYWTPGTTQVFILNSEEFIKEPEQFEGLKFRTAGRWQSNQIELLGASPVNMDPGELYLALQNNTVDGTIQNVNLTYSSKIYEVAPKLALASTPVNANIYVINSDVWNKISKEDQEIIKEISDEVGLNSFEYSLEQEELIVDSIIDEGAEIYELSEEETGVLLDQLDLVVPEIVDSLDEVGKELYEIKKQYK